MDGGRHPETRPEPARPGPDDGPLTRTSAVPPLPPRLDAAALAEGWRPPVPLLATAALLPEALAVAGCGLLAGALLRGLGLAAAAPSAALAGGMALAYLALAVLFDARPRPPAQRRLGRALRVLAAAFACAALLAVPAGGWPGLAGLAPWCVLALGAVGGLRAAHGRLAARVPALAEPRRRAALVGSSPSALALLDQLVARPDCDLLMVGFFDDRATRLDLLSGRLPRLGGIDALVALAEDQELSDVFLALPWTAGTRIAQLVDRLRFLPVTVHLVPDRPLPDLPVERHERRQLVLPVLLRPPVPAAGVRAKTLFDVAAAALLMVPLLPVFAVVAALIRLDSPGPVFFRQVRVGQYGRRFSIWKFRSLHVAQADAGAETLVTSGDRRVTRVGRYLRKYSVDELPQVLNVLWGEMALVGPRPHAPRAKADGRIYSEVVRDYPLRYRVRPGLTGWAQVSGFRGETDTEEKLVKRVEYDFAYIRNWSFWLDLWILVRTVPAALRPPRHNR